MRSDAVATAATPTPAPGAKPRTLAEALRRALEKEDDPKLRQWLVALLADERDRDDANP